MADAARRDTDGPNRQPLAEIDILWITAGSRLRRRHDRDDRRRRNRASRISCSAACRGSRRSRFHNPLLAAENGDEFLEPFHRAAEGDARAVHPRRRRLDPDENNKAEGYWAAFGTDPATGQPITTCEWIDRLAPHAWAVMAVGTCATYGGIHAMEGNPTGCMGLPDYLGWDWKSTAGIPIVCIPGCPTQPDNLTETLLYLLHMASGRAPMIPLDDALRPTWLFGQTVHEGCDRGGYYEQAEFADEYGSPLCIVKLGCWGPVVQCNVGKRGWMGGIGGCPNVGGICIGCTMPGFPDKFMPFMDQPPGSLLSSHAVMTYGRAIHALRRFTQASLNKVPASRQVRHPRNPPARTHRDEGVEDSRSTRRRRHHRFDAALSTSMSDATAVLSDLAGVLPDEPRQARTQTRREPATSACRSSPAGPSVDARYRTLVEQIPAVVFMAYLDEGIGEAYVSPQIEATLGFSQQEWLEDPVRWYQQIHPDDKERWSIEAADMFLSGEPLRSVYRVIARDGRVRLVPLRGGDDSAGRTGVRGSSTASPSTSPT